MRPCEAPGRNRTSNVTRTLWSIYTYIYCCYLIYALSYANYTQLGRKMNLFQEITLVRCCIRDKTGTPDLGICSWHHFLKFALDQWHVPCFLNTLSYCVWSNGVATRLALQIMLKWSVRLGSLNWRGNNSVVDECSVRLNLPACMLLTIFNTWHIFHILWIVQFHLNFTLKSALRIC